MAVSFGLTPAVLSANQLFHTAKCHFYYIAFIPIVTHTSQVVFFSHMLFVLMHLFVMKSPFIDLLVHPSHYQKQSRPHITLINSYMFVLLSDLYPVFKKQQQLRMSLHVNKPSSCHELPLRNVFAKIHTIQLSITLNVKWISDEECLSQHDRPDTYLITLLNDYIHIE